MSQQEKITVSRFRTMKSPEARPVVLTAYDHPSAKLLDAAGVDAILVGDSLANVIQGKKTTIPVTLDEMIYHAEMVARAVQRALVIVDLPFPYCQSGPDMALAAAVRIVKETGADAVKIEGGLERTATIEAVVNAGIPVFGHCGLMPQSVLARGEYVMERDKNQLLANAQSIEKAGVFAMVLECVPEADAREVTKMVTIPTIGIGAGAHCDGQVQVLHDLLGITDSPPKHVRQYANLSTIISEAVAKYCQDVRNG